MGVAAEISQHLFGTAERRLGINDPIDASELLKALRERGGIGKDGEIAKEAQLARVERVLQALQEQAAEHPGRGGPRQKETGPAGDRACAVERRSTARHDAVNMWMVLQGLPPGVEDGGYPELCA